MDVSITRVNAADQLTDSFLTAATRILGDLVAADAAIGWTAPPSHAEVASLLRGVAQQAAAGDASLVLARVEDELVGLGYWTRYERPTHRPNAELEKVVVAGGQQGRGYGRALMTALIESAVEARIEHLTLDLRDDNVAATSLYESCGFREYGRLEDFVAVGERRLGKVFMVLDLRPHV